MEKESKIYVPGHRGLVGTLLTERLAASGYTNVIVRSHKELDLTRQTEVEHFFEQERPEYVFLVAARTGGVMARQEKPVEMMVDNVAITTNILMAALKFEVKKLLYVASGLVYPADAEQPLRPQSVGKGVLGPADEPYALPKIMGIRLCQYMRRQYGKNFISCIPCNTYGQVNEKDTQFIPATIKKFAAGGDEVVIWGDGTPTREFLHGDDLADALIFLMENYDGEEPINVGTNQERTIAQVVDILQQVSNFQGKVTYDITKPNGAKRLFMDSSALKELGWIPKISLEDGLKREYERYKTKL